PARGAGLGAGGEDREVEAVTGGRSVSPYRDISVLFALLVALYPASAQAFARTRALSDGGGSCLYWGPRTVGYRVGPAELPGLSPDALTAAIEAGFSAWVGWDCSDFSYVDLGPTRS